jgi:hypothetical protein
MALGHGAAKLDSQGVRGKHDYTDRVIRDKRYKAWVATDKQITELYDLKDDPLEQKNLLGSTDTGVGAAIRKFQAVIDKTPDKDARPRYRKREPLPWDKKYSADEAPTKSRDRKRRKKG